MITLTETAALTKKASVFIVIFLVFIIIAWIGFSYWYNNIYLPSLPKVEEKADLKFGNIPAIKLPETSASSANYTYSLDTDTGSLPKDIPKLVKVYPITQLSADLLALDRAKALATKLDFDSDPQMLTSTQYRFQDKLGGQLTIDLVTGNFSYKHNIASESANLKESFEFSTTDSIVKGLKNFLFSKNLLKDQLNEGHGKVVFSSPNQADSEFATVYLWQQDVDKKPIITSTFNEGLIKAQVTTNSVEDEKYINLDYIYWPIDLENAHTYYIKTADEAYKELQNGKGSVVIEPPSAKASITKVYLGYYLTKDYQPYLEPIYVFEGSQFAAIVPAIQDQYLEK